MFSISANLVDKTAARVIFAVLGILVASLFVLFGLDFLRVDPQTEPQSFSIGLAMLLGQVGWWGRVVTCREWLLRRPVARWALLLLLLVGIATVLYGMAFMPKGPIAWPMLIALLASGILMVFGTALGSRPGPNNSSKPTPLRGAA